MLSHDTRCQEKTQYCGSDSTSDPPNVKMKDKEGSERNRVGHSSLDDKHLDKRLDVRIPPNHCPLAVTPHSHAKICPQIRSLCCLSP